MDEVLAILGDHPPCLLFEQLFLERQSEDMRIQPADADHRQLAEKVDSLWAARDMGTSNNNVQQNPHLTCIPKQIPPRTSNLGNKEGITNAILQCPQPAQNVIPKHPTATGNLCYYHQAFEKLARQCQKPCAWLGNEQARCW